MAEEPFVNIFFEDEKSKPSEPSEPTEEWWKEWVHQSSAQHTSPEIYGYRALKKLYPNHSIVMSQDSRLNLFAFPQAYIIPYKEPLVSNVFFVPVARRLGTIPGILVDNIEYGSFRVAWDKYEFILFTIQFSRGFGTYVQHFILHEGTEEPTRKMIVDAVAWQLELHDEIWVYDKYWYKDHNLWLEVQKGNWKDVILKDKFKKALQKDVFGFFSSEQVYRELAIPWKRGLIMYGPPGNGKTISIKVIMKECQILGYSPLYVKSFDGWMGEEAAMAEVFTLARQMSPCVLVLEDLDSLINDSNRSFFLNQLDGLEGNDGLLVIGTTNHFDKLDPALSGRPSRFDRKYLFDDPDLEERALYCQYWQRKLATNKEIEFPDELVREIAQLTDGFSFAYLKEAFVASLVLLAGLKDEKKDFARVIKEQIEELRKTLDQNPKSVGSSIFLPSPPTHKPIPTAKPSAPSTNLRTRDFKALLDSLSGSMARSDLSSSRIYQAPNPLSVADSSRDARQLLDGLSRSFVAPDPHQRTFAALSGAPRTSAENPSTSTSNLTGVSKSGAEFTWYNAAPPRC